MKHQILLATGNKHKYQEMTDLSNFLGLGSYLNFLTLNNLPTQGQPSFDSWIEDGQNFAENAEIKARYALEYLNSLSQNAAPQIDGILADDSGLVVPSLGGDPGIYSARYAATELNPAPSDMDNRRKLLSQIQALPQAQKPFEAYFVCTLAFLDLNHTPPSSLPMLLLFEGRCYGKLSENERGHGGFGYDPLFIPEGETRSFAEMNSEEKNTQSHRFKAMVEFAEFSNSKWCPSKLKL